MTQRTFDLDTQSFQATVAVPGDKSLGHRALLLAALAEGESRVSGLSSGQDIAATSGFIGHLGVRADGPRFTSPGIARWSQPSDAIDCGNSGTTMRLGAGLLAGSRVSARLVGDESLARRPMGRIVDPLRLLGADIRSEPGGTAPLSIAGGPLRGADVAIPMASAQVRTGVAFAALNADAPTTISSPPGFRDHTERWLVHLGLAARPDDTTLTVSPGVVPPIDIDVPADPSSASFMWAAAAVRPGSRVTTPGVSLNPGRIGFLEILDRMGATVDTTIRGDVLGDPVGDVTVTGADLAGITVGGADAVAALDELPLLAVVAAVASGITTVRDAEELRVKESDRIAGAVALARLAGGAASATEDGFVVEEGSTDGSDHIDSTGDHRIAMAAAIASMARCGPVTISGFDAAGVSWPGFDRVLEGLWS